MLTKLHGESFSMLHGKERIMKLMRKSLVFETIASLFLLASCSDKNPFDTAEEEVDEAVLRAKAAAAQESQKESCRNGEGYNYSCCYNYGIRCEEDYWDGVVDQIACRDDGVGYDYDCCYKYGYRCGKLYSSSSYRSSSSSYSSSSSSYRSSSSSYSSSSSSEKAESSNAYTTKTKKMRFTLTYYKQVSGNWDGISGGGTYSDGDPMISFNIAFIASGGQSSTYKTGKLLSLSDQGSWSGSKTETIDVPAATQDIKVCPIVIDDDWTSDDSKTSGNCYTKYNVGYLNDYTEVAQDDNAAKHYNLEWEWYLY